MRNNLLSQWSGSNPLHFAALIIHSHQITFSFSFSSWILPRLCFHQKFAAVLQETGKNSPLRQNQWILRTFPWWKRAAVLMNVSWSHWPPVLEYFQPLCSFLSAVGLSRPSLLFDQLCLFLSLSFCFFSKLFSQCGNNFPPAVAPPVLKRMWVYRDFPGGTVVKNPPANAGDTGLIPGPRRSHMPWSS